MNWATNGAEFSWKGLGYFGVGAAAGALGAGVGAGISSAMATGGTFGAGFIGSSAAMTATSSFITGAAIGGGAGFSAGFTTGFGNGLLGGQNFGRALGSGFEYGLKGGISGALLGGVLGGLDAVYGDLNHKRNFWTGDDIAMGRKPFSFANTDKHFNAYRSRHGYESGKYYEGILDGTKNGQFDDYIRYRDARPGMLEEGAVYRLNNYTFEGDGILDLSVNGYLGRADMMISNQAGYDFVIRVNGNIVTPTNGYIPLWEGAKNISVQILRFESVGSAIHPLRILIKGFHPSF